MLLLTGHVLCKYILKMARWEGVEPPTAWFVARYSIQLSYQRNKTRIMFKHLLGVNRELS